MRLSLFCAFREMPAEPHACLVAHHLDRHALVLITGPHMAHSHTVHLPRGALLIWRAMCGAGGELPPLPHLPHRC